ncbi:MAG: hypothetical protein AABZ33_14315 [Chloroflexota bacterium]
MDGAQILALVAFVALVGALVLVLRGITRVIAAQRLDEAFRRGIADLASRADMCLAEIVPRVDGVRHRAAFVESITAEAERAARTLGDLAVEARATVVPRDRIVQRDAVTVALERAAQSLERVIRAVRGPIDEPGNESIDARMAVKRGFLDLVHARETLAAVATAATSQRAASGRFARRAGSSG